MADINIHNVESVEIEVREINSSLGEDDTFISTRIYIKESIGDKEIEHALILYSKNGVPIKLKT